MCTGLEEVAVLGGAARGLERPPGMGGLETEEMGASLSVLAGRQVLSPVSLSVTCRVSELAFVGLISVRGCQHPGIRIPTLVQNSSPSPGAPPARGMLGKESKAHGVWEPFSQRSTNQRQPRQRPRSLCEG